MNQCRSAILLFLCAGALAGAGQTSPVIPANSGIKELAYEVPVIPYGSSPEAPWLNIVSNQEVDSDIFVIDAQDSKPRKLISGGSHPAWSPDGSQLAYCTWNGLKFGQIEVVNADGTGRRHITNMKGGACYPDWSPDGTKIAFTAFNVGHSDKNLNGATVILREIFVADKNGGDPVPIASGYAPRWSPGGTMLLILRAPEKNGHDWSVWLATADGKQSKNLIVSDRMVEGATWLPDGKGIAASYMLGGKYSIFRIYLDGSQSQGNQPHRVAIDDKANWYEPKVSPDGKHLIALTDCDARFWDSKSQPICRGVTTVLLDLEKDKTVALATGNRYSVIWERK